MKKRFDDYFYDSYVDARRTGNKPYMTIVAESDSEMTQVFLDKDTLKQFIEHLEDIYKEM